MPPDLQPVDAKRIEKPNLTWHLAAPRRVAASERLRGAIASSGYFRRIEVLSVAIPAPEPFGRAPTGDHSRVPKATQVLSGSHDHR